MRFSAFCLPVSLAFPGANRGRYWGTLMYVTESQSNVTVMVDFFSSVFFITGFLTPYVPPPPQRWYNLFLLCAVL